MFGYDTGRYTTADDNAATIVSLTNGDAGEVRDLLLDAGWTQGYYVRMGSPSGDDPSLVGMLVYSGISRFNDEAGADVGFELLSHAYTDGGYITARGSAPVGDESAITRSRVVGPDGRISQVLNVLFRTGPFSVHFFVIDYADEPPPISLASELGNILIDRIEGSSLEPGVSNRALVLTGDGLRTSWAVYRRLDDEVIPQYLQAPADARADDEFYDAAGDKSRFHVRQWAEIPGKENDFVEFTFVINQFEDAQAAGDALEEWSSGELESPSAGYLSVNDVPGAETFGEASRMYEYTFDRGESRISTGFRYFIQVDSALITFQVDSLAGADRAAVEAIAGAATACAAGDDSCSPMELPASLIDSGSGGSSELG
jgi:hypothetical protein